MRLNWWYDDCNINNNNNAKDFEVDRQCQEIDIEQLVESHMIVDNWDPLGQKRARYWTISKLNMILDKNETHRVKIEPATAHHMVGVSLSAFHKPEIYLLLGIFIQGLKEVIIWPPTNVENWYGYT